MDIEKFLERATTLAGLSGYEEGVNGYIAGSFRPFADEVTLDNLDNVVARMGSGSPRAMICAHQDEIGMMVTTIEKDGCLRMRRIGVDPRILPGMEVSVQTGSGPLYGVIGAKPPHLLTQKDRESAVKLEDLFVDVGLPPEEVHTCVRVGDPIVMLGKPVSLASGAMAGKTMDDRACVASMLVAAELLTRVRFDGSAYFVATSQEEVGSRGARTAANALCPDYAIAVDVAHAEGPGTGKWEAFPQDRLTIVHGPNVHPVLEKTAMRLAKENGISFSTEICPDVTATDAENTQIACGGVPTLVLSVPVRYMHTTVELLRVDVIRDVGRLIALVVEEMAREWEGVKWY